MRGGISTPSTLARPDEELTNFATQDDFPDLIPPGEIWLAEKNLNREGIFFLANALTQLHAKEDGFSEEKAYAAGVNVERALRKRLTGLKFRGGKPHKRVPRSVYVKCYITLDDPKLPIEVWLVDGNVVRSLYKTDYTEGGHGYVYAFATPAELCCGHSTSTSRRPIAKAESHCLAVGPDDSQVVSWESRISAGPPRLEERIRNLWHAPVCLALAIVTAVTRDAQAEGLQFLIDAQTHRGVRETRFRLNLPPLAVFAQAPLRCSHCSTLRREETAEPPRAGLRSRMELYQAALTLLKR